MATFTISTPLQLATLALAIIVLVTEMSRADITGNSALDSDVDSDRNRIIWPGSGNAFGDTDGSANPITTVSPGGDAGTFTCKESGYFSDPTNTSSFIKCTFNSLTGKYEAIKNNCPPGSKFQVNPPLCVRT